ncbi:MAG: RNA polymerase sigma factor [Planctomycetota bacterium]
MAGFDEVYSAYGPSVRAYLARLTGDAWVADELQQETFYRYLRAGADLAARNGSLGPWLFKVATNLARDRARRKKPEPLDTEPAANGTDGAAASSARDVDQCIRREVERLPAELKEAFLLRAHHTLTYHQVAAALEISERTAKERFRLAREILAHRLGPMLGEERR